MVIKQGEELAQLCARILAKAGAEPSIAERVSRHLINANLAGVDSHGVLRLPDYAAYLQDSRVAPNDRIEVISDKGAACLLDAHFTFGIVAAQRAAQLAAERARKLGIGAASVRNSTHIGRLGDYMEELARDGLVGFICCNAQGAGQFVAPWGGREARISTNPMAWGFPTGREEGPLVLDMATSAWPEGKVRLKMRVGEPVPLGRVIRADGSETTDPKDLFGPPPGALLPFGEHKGYGLGLVVEMLSGALSGGGCCHQADNSHTHESAFFVMAMDVGSLLPLEEATVIIDRLLAWVKTSAPAQPDGKVLVPYELEVGERKRRSSQGIPLGDQIWERIVTVARELDVSLED